MPNNNVTEQIVQLLGVEFPPPLDPSEINTRTAQQVCQRAVQFAILWPATQWFRPSG